MVTVPAELQVFWRPTAVVGLGLYGFATLNSTDSFGAPPSHSKWAVSARAPPKRRMQPSGRGRPALLVGAAPRWPFQWKRQFVWAQA